MKRNFFARRLLFYTDTLCRDPGLIFNELQPGDDIILETNRNHRLADIDRYFATFHTISRSRFSSLNHQAGERQIFTSL
jgi:hypothetical protein